MAPLEDGSRSWHRSDLHPDDPDRVQFNPYSRLTEEDAQTEIDARAAGEWEGVLRVGSNFVVRLHGPTLVQTAALLQAELDRYLEPPVSSEGREAG